MEAILLALVRTRGLHIALALTAAALAGCGDDSIQADDLPLIEGADIVEFQGAKPPTPGQLLYMVVAGPGALSSHELERAERDYLVDEGWNVRTTRNGVEAESPDEEFFVTFQAGPCVSTGAPQPLEDQSVRAARADRPILCATLSSR